MLWKAEADCSFLYSCNCRCLIQLILYRDARAIILPSRLSRLTWGFLTVVAYLRTARVLLLIIPGSCCSRGNLRSPVREGSFLTWDLHRHWACAGNSRVTLLHRHSLRLLWGLCKAEKVTVSPESLPYILYYYYLLLFRNFDLFFKCHRLHKAGWQKSGSLNLNERTNAMNTGCWDAAITWVT